MNLIQLIQIVVPLLAKAFPTPDFKDIAAVERWLGGLNGPLAAVIVLLLGRSDQLVGEGPLPTDDDIAAAVEAVCDDETKIDPATIIAIITAIIQLIELWRKRKN